MNKLCAVVTCLFLAIYTYAAEKIRVIMIEKLKIFAFVRGKEYFI